MCIRGTGGTMQSHDRTSLERLQTATTGIELTAGEQRTLKWLSEWEASTVDNVAHIIEKARGAKRTGELSRQDLLQLWGYLQSLKDIYESKAKDAAQRGDSIGNNLTDVYMKMGAEITTMQQELNREAGEV